MREDIVRKALESAKEDETIVHPCGLTLAKEDAARLEGAEDTRSWPIVEDITFFPYGTPLAEVGDVHVTLQEHEDDYVIDAGWQTKKAAVQAAEFYGIGLSYGADTLITEVRHPRREES